MVELVAPAVWLAFAAGMSLARRPVPTWVFALSWLAALAATGVSAGVMSALLAGGLSVVVFAVLAVTGLTSRASTVTFTVALAATPLLWWWVFLPGMVLVAVVSAIRIRRAAGDGYVTLLTAETLTGLGMLPGAGAPTPMGVSRPDVSRIPTPGSGVEQDGDGVIARASRVRVHLPVYLLAGVLLSAVGTFLFG